MVENIAKKLSLPALTSDVSVTAKRLFESKGFNQTQENLIERKGISLTNFSMKKSFNSKWSLTLSLFFVGQLTMFCDELP